MIYRDEERERGYKKVTYHIHIGDENEKSLEEMER